MPYRTESVNPLTFYPPRSGTTIACTASPDSTQRARQLGYPPTELLPGVPALAEDRSRAAPIDLHRASALE